ncbi:MAG: DinB family protein [Candidatus Heimdallarchaeota archaeon]|nr:MAG: DinB family protein [Candidatus Heimdallarchaeota archaeon]
MNNVSSYRDYWQTQYKRVSKYRNEIWQHLDKYDLSHELFTKRPKENLWAIDEILRHMLASEVAYIHQKFDSLASPKDFGVGAQWVGDYKLNMRELPHFALNDIKKLSIDIKAKTHRYFEDSKEEDFFKRVKAPWGEEMMFTDLLEAFYTHEAYHRGQVHYLMNLLGDTLGIKRKKFEQIK